MSFDHILVAHDGDLATITMNRPERRNALSEAHMAELISAFRDIHHNASHRFLPQRYPHSDPGDGESFQLSGHRVGQSGGSALRDGDSGVHADMLPRRSESTDWQSMKRC